MKPLSAVAALALSLCLCACSRPAAQSPDVADSIRKNLNQQNIKDVSVSQDREKGVVTLGGHVASDADKAQAESVAKSLAAGQVVADEIAVLPSGDERDARAVDKNLDSAIDKNLDAVLIENRLDKTVRHDVKNGVVTLKGTVNSEDARQRAQKIAAGVPNVQQVVNELQVKDQKATSTRQ